MEVIKMKKGSWQTQKATTWWLWMLLSLSGVMEIWHYEMVKNMATQYGLETSRIAQTDFYLIGIVACFITIAISVVIIKRLHLQRKQQRARSTYWSQGTMAISLQNGNRKLFTINLMIVVAVITTVASLWWMMQMIMQRHVI